MLLEELINTYEKVKRNIYIIKRGNKAPIIVKFKDDNFFHLVGLHKTNMDMFIPHYITSKSKKYKYIKKYVKKFNNILISEMKENNTLQYRITSFHNIIDMLENDNTSLYDLKYKVPGSVYDGDFGLMKIYENISCLSGLKTVEQENVSIVCAPQSWMASTKTIHLIEYKKPIYMEEITRVPIELYNEKDNLISV